MIPAQPSGDAWNALVATWRARACDLEPYAPAAARAFLAAADELETALAASNEARVSLNDAARLSGYSPDHLGRLIREGKMRNYGTRHRPRVRVGDLPRKALPADEGSRMLGAQ
jgi:hypothetical protein